jgi:glycosyltransferase involved in cell wall biosynthesis
LDKTCILIPAYNAEATLGLVLTRAKSLGMDIIVVNDGSVDGTKKIATENGAHLLEHSSNRGKGVALQTGFAFAIEKGYQTIITLDADGQHDPTEIPFLINIFESVRPDILIASRAMGFDRMTFLRRFWNRLGVRAVSRMCHADITDSQSGFRIIRQEVIRAVPLTTFRFETELELLIKACIKGFLVLSIPIHVSKIDGTDSSHFRPVADTWQVCKIYLKSLFW